MILSKQNISTISSNASLPVPPATVFALPEKMLQFGTGVLLRGLPDYFIDKANKQGLFNGRIVMIKSTSQGDTEAFTRQDNLYTQCVRGIENGRQVNEAIINASVSRVLNASDQWNEVLDLARSEDMQIIVSNTTEVGIALVENEDIHAAPPISFPGKLLAFLYARYQHFKGSKESGMVIIPTELITGNGSKLQSICSQLAARQQLPPDFIEWLQQSNDFCNSLVDRIVPGKLPGDEKAATESRLGYKDDLMIMSEVYRLWAIETSNPRTREILSFSKADEGLVIASDIDKFRELKLRLLNGSHTFTCALALQMGFTTVKEAMEDSSFRNFITALMVEEIVPAIVSNKVSKADGLAFAAQVLDRYSNPFIEHNWMSISLQYSSKMKMRNVPVLQQYFALKNAVPARMALGFAAYLLFMRSDKINEHSFAGKMAGKEYAINDDKAAHLYELWRNDNTNTFVQHTLRDTGLWEANLDALPGFAAAVDKNIESIQTHGIRSVVQQLQLAAAQ
ncbi:MAG TPA: tagaturonate reductase [Chitinophagaceae bacterium]|nr:tagaturonate reductase [Chitinophagaceae bacterium]